MAPNTNIELGKRIRQRRLELEKTQGDIAAQIGVAISTVQRYEAGSIDRPKIPVIEAIAKALAVSPEWLVGKSSDPTPSISVPSNITPLPQMKAWKILGATACGKPLHRKLLDETILAPSDIKADVVFRCVGDSMINARIFDGDAVFIRLQPEVENGQIAVVRVGDEYTLKRVYTGEGYVELRAENPTFSPIILRGEELIPENYEVVGRAVAFLSVVC